MSGEITNKKKLHIDIVSDVHCPWCFLGKRRLDWALQERKERFESISISWHPFELNELESPEPYMDYLAAKFGSKQRLTEAFTYLQGLGEAEGIKFAFERIKHSYRSRPLHLMLNQVQGEKQHLWSDLLFQAHFEQGVDFSQSEEAAYWFQSQGWPATSYAEAQKDPKEQASLEKAFAFAEQLGVQGVPLYILNTEKSYSGALERDTWLNILDSI